MAWLSMCLSARRRFPKLAIGRCRYDAVPVMRVVQVPLARWEGCRASVRQRHCPGLAAARHARAVVSSARPYPGRRRGRCIYTLCRCSAVPVVTAVHVPLARWDACRASVRQRHCPGLAAARHARAVVSSARPYRCRGNPPEPNPTAVRLFPARSDAFLLCTPDVVRGCNDPNFVVIAPRVLVWVRHRPVTSS